MLAKKSKLRKVAKAAKPVKAAKVGKIKKGATKATPKKAKIINMATAKAKAKQSKIVKPYTKSSLLSTLAENTNLKKADIANVFEYLNLIIEGHLKKSGPGKFVLPGMLKMSVKAVPAKKARKGINPFNGESP